MRTYLEGKKNKLKEKHVESIEQLVNRVSTSLDTSFVSVNFGKNIQTVTQHSDLQGKSKVNYFFTILSYTFSETIWNILSKE